MVGVEDRPRAIVGTDAREGGHPREHRGLLPARRETNSVPGVRVVAGAGLEDHGGTAFAATLQPEPATIPDVHQTGEVTTRRGRQRGGWRGLGHGRERHAEQAGDQEDVEQAHGYSLRVAVAGNPSALASVVTSRAPPYTQVPGCQFGQNRGTRARPMFRLDHPTLARKE